MAEEARDYFIRQFDTAWKLAAFHLDGLTTAECVWRPAPNGPHVKQLSDGSWKADWPDNEAYDAGPPSIAWITWHIGFWWSMVIDHSFGRGTLTREDVVWLGDADQLRKWLVGLRDMWRAELDNITDEELRSTRRTKWPYTNRPFGDVVAWLNIELAKNAAEIGFARFLFAVRRAT
jgi:hypothetical protein